MKKRQVAILGSTGSIGRSTLDVVRHLGYSVTALAAHSNIELLEAQAREFSPSLIAVFDAMKADELQKRLPHIEVVAGKQGLIEVARHEASDILVSALSGAIGILPTVAAIEAGKDVALANKEVLVAAGSLVMRLAQEKGVKIIPVDSEHSALFQCLDGRDPSTVRRLILTASGGPFFNHSLEQLERISLEDALKHPTWKMGTKITVDSSTLMNKGLEVIEAYWLFGVSTDKIDVVVHPQSIIHSMVEFIDGSIIAQLSQPDMKLPIQYALTYPSRSQGTLPPFDITRSHRLDFIPVDNIKFRCLPLAYEALDKGHSAPCFLNAANEVLVDRFSKRQISWLDIQRKLDKLMSSHRVQNVDSFEGLFEVDAMAREEALIS